MSFVRSVVVLVSCCLAIVFAYLLGYALSSHHTTPLLVGVVLLAVSAILIYLQGRRKV